MIPDFEKRFYLETDASNKGIGAVLSQMDENNQLRPIAYYSRKLSKSEQNYSASEKEMLAIVNAIEHYKEFLYGTEFTVITDHQPLKWINTVKNPAPRLVRWIIRLENYEFEIMYRAGNKNQDADGLSRCPMDKPTETSQEDDNTFVINNMNIQIMNKFFTMLF